MMKRDKNRKLEKEEPYSSANCILEACPEEGTGSLWLGDVHSLENKAMIEKNRIRHIVSCIKHFEPQVRLKDKSNKIKILYLPLRDKADEDIFQFFEEAHKFIEQGRSLGDGVLVHCFAGVSRSATIVCSYIMKIQGLGFYAALSFIEKKRDCVSPNKGFATQLLKYEEVLEDSRKKKQIAGNEGQAQQENQEQCNQLAEAQNKMKSIVISQNIQAKEEQLLPKPKKITPQSAQNRDTLEKQKSLDNERLNKKAMLSFMAKDIYKIDPLLL